MLTVLVKIIFVGILIQAVDTATKCSDIPVALKDIAKELGYKTEEYDITTEDGYILKMFRNIGDPTRPVLSVHGNLDSSDSILVRGNTSLGMHLLRNNYDLWRINYRGSVYSRRHRNMNPDVDARFWNFSMHEIGYYDIPTAIDFVLKKTGQQKLSAIGYSTGTTALLILGATRPEYNDKIKIMISLATICYTHNLNPIYSVGLQILPKLQGTLETLGWYEILGPRMLLKRMLNTVCDVKDKAIFAICRLVAHPITSASPEDIEPQFITKIIARFPGSAGMRILYHFGQIFKSKIFARYDYGPAQNKILYNSTRPLQYNLRKVTMKVAIFAAKNDMVSTIADVNLLRMRLPNVVEYRLINADTFTHLSYIFGRNTPNFMNPQILVILDKYN